MVQTTNRFFDEVARLMNDAAGAAQGVRREFETLFRSQAERILRDLAVVQREEFEAVKDMARLAREENEALKVPHCRIGSLAGGARKCDACFLRRILPAGSASSGLVSAGAAVRPGPAFLVFPRWRRYKRGFRASNHLWHPWRLPRKFSKPMTRA
jgi:BMFP domain-containing protein YqiC